MRREEDIRFEGKTRRKARLYEHVSLRITAVASASLFRTCIAALRLRKRLRNRGDDQSVMGLKISSCVGRQLNS